MQRHSGCLSGFPLFRSHRLSRYALLDYVDDAIAYVFLSGGKCLLLVLFEYRFGTQFLFGGVSLPIRCVEAIHDPVDDADDPVDDGRFLRLVGIFGQVDDPVVYLDVVVDKAPLDDRLVHRLGLVEIRFAEHCAG